MRVKLSDIIAEAQPGADYMVYTIKGHPDDIMLIGKDAKGEWQRAGRVWAEVFPALIEGLRRTRKVVWDADRRAFLTGSRKQLAYTPPPPPPPPPTPPPAKNRPQHERNWAIWRSYKVDGERYADIGRRHGITGSRAHDLVRKCGREIFWALRWPDRVEKGRAERIRNALDGVEIFFPADDRDYMRMPDGREFFLNGDPKIED